MKLLFSFVIHGMLGIHKANFNSHKEAYVTPHKKIWCEHIQKKCALEKGESLNSL